MKNLDHQDNYVAQPLEAVIAAGRRIHATIDALDALIADRLGLHRSDLRALNHLEQGPLTASELGQRLALSSGSVTALADRLERSGLVERSRTSSDRRQVGIALTSSAFQTIGPMYRSVADAMRQAFSGRDAAELRHAHEVLDTFADALGRGVAVLRSTDNQTKGD